jgi:hypothetical protein
MDNIKRIVAVAVAGRGPSISAAAARAMCGRTSTG